MEVPRVPFVESGDDHALAAFEQCLIDLIQSEAPIHVAGFPSSRTRVILTTQGTQYETHPVYPLLDDSPKPKSATGRVVGYEYRFGGLEVDIADGTEGSYTSFPLTAVSTFDIVQAA